MRRDAAEECLVGVAPGLVGGDGDHSPHSAAASQKKPKAIDRHIGATGLRDWAEGSGPLAPLGGEDGQWLNSGFTVWSGPGSREPQAAL